MKKKLPALVLAAAMTLSLAACGGSKTETPADSSSDAAADTETPAEGASYTVGICQLVQHPALDAATQGFIARQNSNGHTLYSLAYRRISSRPIPCSV